MSNLKYSLHKTRVRLIVTVWT